MEVEFGFSYVDMLPTLTLVFWLIILRGGKRGGGKGGKEGRREEGEGRRM